MSAELECNYRELWKSIKNQAAMETTVSQGGLSGGESSAQPGSATGSPVVTRKALMPKIIKGFVFRTGTSQAQATERLTLNPMRVNETIELYHIFLKAALTHFQTCQSKLVQLIR